MRNGTLLIIMWGFFAPGFRVWCRMVQSIKGECASEWTVWLAGSLLKRVLVYYFSRFLVHTSKSFTYISIFNRTTHLPHPDAVGVSNAEVLWGGAGERVIPKQTKLFIFASRTFFFHTWRTAAHILTLIHKRKWKYTSVVVRFSLVLFLSNGGSQKKCVNRDIAIVRICVSNECYISILYFDIERVYIFNKNLKSNKPRRFQRLV